MDFLEFFKNKRIVIAGGGGFVGGYIKTILDRVPCQVFIPRTSDGIDFRRQADCSSYIKETKPELLINCAAKQGGIAYHVNRQADLFLDNLQMGISLMEAAHQGGVKKFVNVIAGCSYPGYLEKEELNEDDYWNGKVHDTVFSYGYARKLTVPYGLALKLQHGFNSIHLIMANMYGPGEHMDASQSKALAALVRKFYEAKKNNAPRVEVWGSGRPIRDWLYVADGAEGILRAAAGYDEVEPLNIATGQGISVKELAETVAKTMDYQGEIFFDVSKPDGALKKTFGIGRMKEKLHWTPQTSLAEGIKEMKEWLDQSYDKAIQY